MQGLAQSRRLTEQFRAMNVASDGEAAREDVLELTQRLLDAWHCLSDVSLEPLPPVKSTAYVCPVCKKETGTTLGRRSKEWATALAVQQHM